ncbi:vitamin B12 dependent-methionine synthase activation domain-containing protein [Ruminococcus sp.]|uniref:vitamin B12 dependent-methionine synthase activation domain-containing protein n=1 Tax=Ruminococcus sp. TaxID=41978 RepID=UPI0025D36061|nr:vitamin B12 dependent-methionine synthase activation domain-containing protein [Ruminococcus sp.]MBQ8967637.1 methionine synthase [Ruminococcus sp.]
MNGYLQVELDSLNKSEALRYMGYGSTAPDEKIMSMMNEVEKTLLQVIKPCCIYHVFDIEARENSVAVCGTALVLEGKAITEHLAGCTKCVLMAATLSAHADRVIRRYEATDMTYAVMADFLASAAVEQVCDRADEQVRKEFGEFYQTWRFSPGYGDLPLDIQGSFLDVLQAQKRIGLNATENNILTPRKSVTAVIGLSDHEIPKGRQGCTACNMKDVCQFRKRGDHCGI